MLQRTQREVLLSLIAAPEKPLLRRFDGSLFNPNLVLEEIEHHYRGPSPCFQSDGDGCDCRIVGPGRFQFFRYGWLQPIVPELLALPPEDLSRLNPVNSRIVANSIAHVDRMFRTVQYQGIWWLYLRDNTDPPLLMTPDHYLRRRIQAFDELQVILEEEAEELDAIERGDLIEGEEESPDQIPVHVWGLTFGTESFTPN